MGRVIVAFAAALVLAAVVIACGGSSTDSTTTAPATTGTEAAPATPADAGTPGGTGSEEAGQLFADNCVSCHGADGSGGSGPDIRGEDDLSRVRIQIENGGDGMPAFSSQLTPGQIDALAQFVTGGLR